jgi:hypothetical protein
MVVSDRLQPLHAISKLAPPKVKPRTNFFVI